MQMNSDDFRYMLRGKQLKSLSSQQAHLLAPIDIRGPGNDRALLLLHGFGSSPAVYRQLLPALSPYDAIVCPTLPGHSESLRAFTAVKAGDWLSTAEHACAALMKDYQRVDVMGLSLGGLLACYLSQRFALNHLYLLAPALKLQLNIPLSLMGARLLHWLGFHYLRNGAGNLCSSLYNELAYRQLPLTAIIEILTLVNTFQFIPPSCPTDLFLGRYDQVINSMQVATYFMNLPTCTTHWLPNSAHVLPLDEDIDTIIACLQSNLKRV